MHRRHLFSFKLAVLVNSWLKVQFVSNLDDDMSD
jgi:hypothetical protein